MLQAEHLNLIKDIAVQSNFLFENSNITTRTSCKYLSVSSYITPIYAAIWYYIPYELRIYFVVNSSHAYKSFVS